MQLRVTVKRLNKRRFIPWQIPEPTGIVGQVDEGYIFEGVEVGLAEIPNPAIGRWYRDRDGYYYWGGGVREVGPIGFLSLGILPLESLAPEIIVQHNYNSLVQDIPTEWKRTRGKNVIIAVLDGGFITHRDFQNNIIKTFNAVNNSSSVQPIGNDDLNHGNNIAGLIAASSVFEEGVMGVAPEAKLIVIKISNNGNIGCREVLNGLDFAIHQTEANVINLSLSVDKDEYKLFRNNFLTLFQAAKNKGKIIIASAGDNDDLLVNNSILLQPSNEDYCITVGTINQTFIQSNPNPTYHHRLNYIIPNQSLISCAGLNNTYSTINNCSMAAGIFSGVAALLYSHHNGFANKEVFIEEFNKPLAVISSNPSMNLKIFKS